MADPEGGAQGCAPSSAEPWMASLKINDTTHLASELCRGRPLSFGYFSEAASQRKV